MVIEEEDEILEEIPLVDELTDEDQEEAARARQQQLPRALPRTASGLPLLVLLGLGSIGMSLVFRLRRFLSR